MSVEINQELQMWRDFDKWLKEVALGKDQYDLLMAEFRKDYSPTYSTGHNEDDTVTSEEEYLTECDKCEFRKKCLTQKLFWKDKNGKEHIKTLFECPYEYYSHRENETVVTE